MKKINLTAGILILLSLVLSFFISVTRINGEGMQPTLSNGDLIFYSNKFYKPERGDIVLYSQPNGSTQVGRVLATQGESIRIQDGSVYLDLNFAKYQLLESYSNPGDTYTNSADQNKWYVISQYKYFVLQDNRKDTPVDIEASMVHQNRILGKYLFSL